MTDIAAQPQKSAMIWLSPLEPVQLISLVQPVCGVGVGLSKNGGPRALGRAGNKPSASELEDVMSAADQQEIVQGVADARALPPAFAHLTPTQFKVLQGVHSGLLNKQIAFDLGIAETTVKAHMTALMRKLNVRNRTQVAIAAQTLSLHA